MIIDALTICLEENLCEFGDEHFRVNSKTAIGPCHSCDYPDFFVGELDDKLVQIQNLEAENIEHTPWTIFRDDGCSLDCSLFTGRIFVG